MKKLGICVVLCVVLLGSTISLADSADQGYKEIEIEREGSNLQTYSLSSLAKYFKGRSEEKSELMFTGTLNEYRRYQKRSIASSIGYSGNHYLRAYVETFKTATDTGRVTRIKGFSLPSKCAYMRDYPVPGRARAFYGID